MVKQLAFLFRYALCALLAAGLLVPTFAAPNSTERLELLLQRATVIATNLELQLVNSESALAKTRESFENLKKDSESTIAQLKSDLMISNEDLNQALQKVASLEESLAKLETKLAQLEEQHKQELLGWQITAGSAIVIAIGAIIWGCMR